MKSSPLHTARLLGIFMFTRLVVSTAFRMVYPFLPALSRGLGVPLEVVAAAVSARSALGFFGPALGALADWRGRKQALVAALLVLGACMALIAALPGYTVFFVSMLISGGAVVVIDSSIHAYLGDKIPYEQRGRAAAFVELGWSLAFVAGIPLVGWAMERSGWSAPFLWVGLAVLAAGGLIALFTPGLPPSAGSLAGLRSGLRQVIQPAALLGLAMAVLIVIANQVVSIIFGVWMEDSFGLRLDQLGAASSVIGLAGVAGVGTAILLTDRLGKRPAIGLGLGVNTLACLAIDLGGSHRGSAVTALFFWYLSGEVTLTSLLPLMTALATRARGAFMAAVLAAFSLGDSIGALLGPAIFRTGLLGNVLTAAAFNLAGLFFLIIFVRPASEPGDLIPVTTE